MGHYIDLLKKTLKENTDYASGKMDPYEASMFDNKLKMQNILRGNSPGMYDNNTVNEKIAYHMSEMVKLHKEKENLWSQLEQLKKTPGTPQNEIYHLHRKINNIDYKFQDHLKHVNEYQSNRLPLDP